MRQAFEGYIHYIHDDEEVKKAWAYAIMVGAEELCSTTRGLPTPCLPWRALNFYLFIYKKSII